MLQPELHLMTEEMVFDHLYLLQPVLIGQTNEKTQNMKLGNQFREKIFSLFSPNRSIKLLKSGPISSQERSSEFHTTIRRTVGISDKKLISCSSQKIP